MVFIGREQADLIRDHFPDEPLSSIFRDAMQSASNDISLAADGTNDRKLAGASTAGLAVMLLVPMPVAVLTADPRLIDFDDAAQLGFGFNQGRADFVAHGMCCAVGTKAHHALNLKGADTFFAGEHQVGDAKPLPQRLVRILEDRPSDAREPVAVLGANLALPVKTGSQRIDLGIAAARAFDAFGPTASDQVGPAGFLIGESLLELGDGHLMDWLGAARHGVSSLVKGYSHAG